MPERLRFTMAKLLKELGVPPPLIAEEVAAMAEVGIGRIQRKTSCTNSAAASREPMYRKAKAQPPSGWVLDGATP